MEPPIALAEAQDRLHRALPAPGRSPAPETVPLPEALDRCLATDVPAASDLPPFDRSLVDGYAVRCADGLALPLGGAVAMGRAAAPLPAGTAVAVPTGGMVPEGADAVVMQEDVRLAGGTVHLGRHARPEENIVRRGADARAGAVVLPAGRRIGPAEIAMLATVGATEVPVWPRLRVAVLSTGDELVAPGAPTAPGQVPDSNAPALCAALRRDGAVPTFLGVVPDDRAALEAAVRGALGYDALLCSGGSSVGRHDFVPEVLSAVLGVPPLFSGISIRPGRPTSVFVAPRGPWAVALPGHAVSALVVYELLLRAAVLRRGGQGEARPRGIAPARLSAAVRAPAGRDLYVRVRLEGATAVPLAGPSATIGNLARADGLVHVRAGTEAPAGAEVAVALL